MSLTLFLMLLPALIIVLVMRYVLHQTITWAEAAAQFGIAVLISVVIWQIGLHSRMTDRQFLNGVVTEKRQDRVSCSHSYSCNCRTTKDGTTCDTCYEHVNDWNWVIASNAIKGDDGEYTVDRIDRRGRYAPSRWTAVRLGEPVALERRFANYILASPDSIYHTRSDNLHLPPYPDAYDYSYADRVIASGVSVPDLPLWNQHLSEILGRLGPQKQANAIVVITNDVSPQFGADLRNAWLGGKKNDTVVVIGAPRYPKIAWVNVFSWSKHDMLNVALRNDIMEQKMVDRERVLAAVEHNIDRYFERRPMEEYAYLRDSIEPTPRYQVFGWVMAILMPILLGWFFHRFDFGNGHYRHRRFT